MKSLRNARVLVTLLVVAAAVSSCSRFGLRNQTACSEPQLPANLSNNPPLKVEPGMDLPDTRNAVRVPVLTEPEKPRGKADPCLSRPPTYGSGAG
jgi:hypothetical protein